MPSLLLVFAFALTGGAVWYLTRPLRRAHADTGSEQRETVQQLTQVRERLLAQLNELDVDTGDHAMDSSVLADERARLEGELAQVLKHLEQSAPVVAADADTPRHAWRAATIALALIVPVLAAGLYAANHYQTLARLGDPAATADAVPPMVREMVARLERRLREQPNDAEGWARLGRAYDVLERENEAEQAYERAYQLAPDNPEIIAAYGGMLVSRNPAQPPAQAVALFQRLHRIDPQHPGALWILGLVAFNDNKFRQATQYWETLLKQLPADSEVEPQIRHALDVARHRIAQTK